MGLVIANSLDDHNRYNNDHHPTIIAHNYNF
jgi:hypothetical protein